MKELTERTLIPLGMAIIAIGSTAMFVTKWIDQVQANTRQIDIIVEERAKLLKEYTKALQDINARLIIIEYKIDHKL